jgi:Relaxase/Mobilisation nuclease domain
MIPRIQTGSSFKGAGLYYLHDKRHEGEAERLTTDRVAWTHAINTLENDPEAVLSEMRRTAFDQPLLKMLSGNRIDGRPTEKTVMTVSLAWSPEQTPTKDDMIEAGLSFLQHMKWEEHQVLFVSHDDTKHPHVHLIINRVHPETGMTIDDGWAKIRSQKWALAFERDHGHVYCAVREAKYGHDRRGDAHGMTYREWTLWKEISKENFVEPEYQRALEAGEWDVLKSTQRDRRDSFWKETGQLHKELRTALRETVRQEFAGEWSDYAKVKTTRDREATMYDREARRAIRELRRAGNTRKVVTEVVKGNDGRTYRKRRGIESPGIERIKERQKAYHARQKEELWEMRKDISSRQKDRLEALAEPALTKLRDDRERAYNAVLAEHRAEKSELRNDQSKGERRHDLLDGLGPKEPRAESALTPEQAAAYVEQARATTARQDEFDRARKETTAADRARSIQPGRDPLHSKPEKEVTARSLEQRTKEQTHQAASREADVESYLAKRAHDRARDRGGGFRDR